MADLEFIKDADPILRTPQKMPIASLFQFNQPTRSWIETTGVVSYVNAQLGFYMQGSDSGILVKPAHPISLAPGDEVTVTGEPAWDPDYHSLIRIARVLKTGRTVALDAGFLTTGIVEYLAHRVKRAWCALRGSLNIRAWRPGAPRST